MLAKFIKALLNPKKAWRFLSQAIKYSFRKKQGVLIIVGLAEDGVLGLIFRGYKKIYGFEANPERYDAIVKKFSKYPNVHLFNYAVSDRKGKVTFNISSNNHGASSSLGSFREDWDEFRNGRVQMEKKIEIQSINLYEFCIENNITYIDDYISDIQGMDLEVLKTMNPMILERKIGTITCEVTKNDRGNIYKGLPDNSKNGFNEILNEHYKLIAKGWGMLKDNQFDPIPDESWEMDCKWERKKI